MADRPYAAGFGARVGAKAPSGSRKGRAAPSPDWRTHESRLGNRRQTMGRWIKGIPASGRLRGRLRALGHGGGEATEVYSWLVRLASPLTLEEAL